MGERAYDISFRHLSAKNKEEHQQLHANVGMTNIELPYAHPKSRFCACCHSYLTSRNAAQKFWES